MTEIKKELEAIHSIKSKGAGDEEEFVLGQHYPPGVVGMKQLVKCWEYNLKENKRLQKEADGMNKPLCDEIDELIYDNDLLKEELTESIAFWEGKNEDKKDTIKKLKKEIEELRLQAFGVNCNMTGEGIILKPPTREDYIVMVDELKEENKELKENLGYSEDNVKELTHERYERYGLEEENAELKKELLKYTKGWVEKNDKGKITKKHHSYEKLQGLYDKYSPHRNKGMKPFQLLDDD